MLRVSFNPCFSGSCSRIVINGVILDNIADCFNPCFSGSCSRICGFAQVHKVTKVSILVLVDLAHEYPDYFFDIKKRYRGFNPCFSGSCSRITEKASLEDMLSVRFNPCFNGSCSRILFFYKIRSEMQGVSILVLMDLAHES